MVGFVDESTGQVNHFVQDTQPSPEALLVIMRKDEQLWNDLLWVSGGALNFPNAHTMYSITCLHQMELQSCKESDRSLPFSKLGVPKLQALLLLHIAVAWAQYAVGTRESFLMDVTTDLPHMEVKWLKSLRDYLRQVKGQI
jgi:hypothetical protein